MTRRSPFIRGMGCGGWAYCGSCGGVCSQDDSDERPYKPTPYPQVPPDPRRNTLAYWTMPTLRRLPSGAYDYSGKTDNERGDK